MRRYTPEGRNLPLTRTRVCDLGDRFRKLAYKKYHALADDKKADPVMLAEATANKDEVDADYAKLSVKMIQIKLVVGPPHEEGEESKS